MLHISFSGPKDISESLEDFPYPYSPSGPINGTGLQKNKWIAHVKTYVKTHNIPYKEALKKAKSICK
jgi:hypothetical protein